VRGQFERAALLFGVTTAMRMQIGTPWIPVEQMRYGRLIDHGQARLNHERWTVAWATGQAMTLEQAVACALSDET